MTNHSCVERYTQDAGWRLCDVENVTGFSSQAVGKVEESPAREENDNSSRLNAYCLHTSELLKPLVIYV